MSEPSATLPRFALTRQEAAKSIGASVDYFEEYVQPEIKLVRRGRKKLVPVAELEAWVTRNAEAVLPEGSR